MKKIILLFAGILVIFMGTAPKAWSVTTINFTITTDILEIIEGEFQAEFMYTLNEWNAFAFRAGYYQGPEYSDDKYGDDKRHWEIGGRWRRFFIQQAPHFLFIGLGFDNRPEDNTITPTGEVGFNLNYRPIALSAIAFGGYEVHWNNSSRDRWVYGIELRAGVSF